jgi:hypothetical protein
MEFLTVVAEESKHIFYNGIGKENNLWFANPM